MHLGVEVSYLCSQAVYAVYLQEPLWSFMSLSWEYMYASVLQTLALNIGPPFLACPLTSAASSHFGPEAISGHSCYNGVFGALFFTHFTISLRSECILTTKTHL